MYASHQDNAKMKARSADFQVYFTIAHPSFNFMTDWTHFQSANFKKLCKKLSAVRLQSLRDKK